MTVIQTFAAAVDLQGLIVYLGIVATLLTAVAWATYRDREKERRKTRVWAAKAVVADNGNTGQAVPDVKQKRAA